MTCNEFDDEIAIQQEISKLEKRLTYLTGWTYEVAMKRKFINHRIANLKYMLANPGVVII